MEETRINVTYETLYELLRTEKGREELQKLNSSFFSDVLNYLQEKKKILTDEKQDLFSFEEKEKTKKQLENIRRILSELYERREKKIINMALNKSRTNSNIIDMSSLLGEEKKLFDSLISLLGRFRKGIILNLLNEKMPVLDEEKELKEIKGETAKIELEKETPEAKDSKLVRFLHGVPRFVGTELEEYGPFEKEDIANLPDEIASLLISKGRAEEIRED